MEINDKQFIAGFNSGYLLAEYEPDIITSILKDVQPTMSYISGMSFGQREYDLEQSKSQLNEVEKLRQNKNFAKEVERN